MKTGTGPQKTPSSSAGLRARHYRPVATGFDYATTDSPFYDPDFPPIHFPHSFKSEGKDIQSFMWLAEGSDSKGCVILCPQAFGGDALDSLVPALVGAGINVMRFNPRGMWDDEQDFSFVGEIEDLHAAVAFLHQDGGRHTVPAVGRSFLIDVEKIAVIGKSGGGGAVGWVAAAENPQLNTVISVCPGRQDMHRPPFTESHRKTWEALKEATAGRIDLVKWLSSMSDADFDRLSMTRAAPRLVDKQVLLVGSSRPEYVQNTHRPIVQSMEEAGAEHFSEIILEADDYFLTARIALAKVIISWLKTECGF